MSNVVQDGRLQKGLTYAEYLVSWRESVLASMADLDKEARKRLYYARYNIERHDAARESYRPSDALLTAGSGVMEPQIWLLLTEDWCADSAFALPVIAAAADAASAELRILRRDEHPDVMDAYLSDGARSIPMLVAFSMSGDELFRWGSRPKALVARRADWAAEGKSKGELIAAAVEWYASGNLVEIDAELADLLLESSGVSIS
jgi:hypothetical protein